MPVKAGHPLEQDTRKGCPYMSHFWELYGVKKTFKGVDYSVLLWVFSLGILERCDGGESS